MPLFRHIVLRPGVYENAAGRHFALSANDLARCRENTLRLLARGWRVPVFVGHVEFASGAGGPRCDAPSVPQQWVGRAQCSTAVGQLVDLTLEPDGALAEVIWIGRQHIARVRRRKLRHSSPEIRPAFALSPEETLGPVIAHIALTRRPLCRGQTRLARLPDSDQYSGFNHFSTKGNAMYDEPEITTPAELPENENETSPQPETDEGAVELSASPVDRATLADRIRRSRKLPKGLRERLCEFVETLQLSADAPAEPVVPVAEAVAMIEAAVPEHLALDDDELEAPSHPRGEDFFRGHSTAMSDEEAERIATEQLAASGFGPAS